MTTEVITIAQCKANAEMGKNGKMKPAVYLSTDGREFKVWTTGQYAVPLPPPGATIQAQIETSVYNGTNQYTIKGWSVAGAAPALVDQPIQQAQPVAPVAAQSAVYVQNPVDPFEEAVSTSLVCQKDRLIIAQVALKAGVEVTASMEVADPATFAIDLAEKFFSWIIVRGNQ